MASNVAVDGDLIHEVPIVSLNFLLVGTLLMLFEFFQTLAFFHGRDEIVADGDELALGSNDALLLFFDFF